MQNACLKMPAQKFRVPYNQLTNNSTNTNVPSNDVTVEIFDGNLENNNAVQLSSTQNHCEFNNHILIWIAMIVYLLWYNGYLQSSLRVLWHVVKFLYNN